MLPLSSAFKKLHLGVLCLTAALIPFRFIFGAVGVGVLIGLAVLQKGVFKSIFSFWNKKALWPFLLYFGLIAMSWFWSADKPEAAFQISAAVSLALLPLFVGSGPPLSATQVGRTLAFFIGGVMAVGLVSMGRAFVIYFQTGATEQWFYHSLVEGGITNANAVYMAWYTLFAMIALAHWPFKEKTFVQSKIRLMSFVFLNIFAILLASRLLVILLIFVNISILYSLMRKYNFSSKKVLIVGFSMAAVFFVVFFTSNGVSNRFKEINYPMQKEDYGLEQEMHFDNLSLRLFLWQNGWKSMQVENLWLSGTGAGDFKEVQKRRITELTKQGYKLEKHKALWEINLHNTYMQALVMYGIPGLLLLIGMLLPPLFFWQRWKVNGVFGGLILLTMAFMVQESVLQTQAGIVFFALFASILWNYNYGWLISKRNSFLKS